MYVPQVFCRCLSLLAVLLLGGVASAQDKKDKEPPGIEIGEEAPDFKLPDQQGEERSLKQILKEHEGPVALVFYRSADW